MKNVIILEKSSKNIIVLDKNSVLRFEKNFERLDNKPKINSVELIGNKTSEQLKLQSTMQPLTNIEIERLIGGN